MWRSLVLLSSSEPPAPLRFLGCVCICLLLFHQRLLRSQRRSSTRQGLEEEGKEEEGWQSPPWLCEAARSTMEVAPLMAMGWNWAVKPRESSPPE